MAFLAFYVAMRNIESVACLLVVEVLSTPTKSYVTVGAFFLASAGGELAAVNILGCVATGADFGGVREHRRAREGVSGIRARSEAFRGD